MYVKICPQSDRQSESLCGSSADTNNSCNVNASRALDSVSSVSASHWPHSFQRDRWQSSALLWPAPRADPSSPSRGHQWRRGEAAPSGEQEAVQNQPSHCDRNTHQDTKYKILKRFCFCDVFYFDWRLNLNIYSECQHHSCSVAANTSVLLFIL